MAKASEVIKLAQSWLGIKEGSAEHKALVNLYNSFLPHPRGYAIKVSDSWCAMFIACLAIKLGITNIIPVECGCGEMIALCQKLGIWVEDDARVPVPGDIIFYDWQDSGIGDNKGWSDHVGLVEKVVGNTIIVIEGNINDSVGRRTVTVNAKSIRGYAVPKYEPEKVSSSTSTSTSGGISITLDELEKGSKGKQVKTLQCVLTGYGYDLGTIDGIFGSKTEVAVKQYQKNNKLTADGIVGKKTWNSLLK